MLYTLILSSLKFTRTQARWATISSEIRQRRLEVELGICLDSMVLFCLWETAFWLLLFSFLKNGAV